MAISLYRKLHMSFWNDEYVLEHLTKPEEKLLYAYLITNSKSSVSGIYEITVFYISMHTGISIEDVRVIFKKLVKDGKIKYNEETKEVFLLNALKYAKSPGNPKYLAQYRSDLLDLKCVDFVKEWFQRAEKFDFRVGFSLADILTRQMIRGIEEQAEEGGTPQGQGPLFAPPGDSSPGDNKPPSKGKEKKGIEKKVKKAKKVKEPFKLPDDVSREVWDAFVEMRKLINKPLTEFAKQLTIEELNKIGQDKNKVLKQSISKSWQGVFPLKEAPEPAKTVPELPPALVDKDETDDPWKGVRA
jgi:hypothetical protein